MSYKKRVETLIGIVEEAGRIIRDLEGKAGYVTHKQDGSVYTQADMDSHKKIVGSLAKAFPCHDILSEEDGVGELGKFSNGYGSPRQALWVIDPNEGTNQFVKTMTGVNPRKLHFGPLVAQLDKDYKTTLGVVYDVGQERLIWASAQCEGVYERVKGKNVPLKLDTGDEIKLVVSYKNVQIEEVIEMLGIKERNIRVVPTCFSVLELVNGSNLVIRPPTSKVKVWDLCALDQFTQSLGGRYTTVYGEAHDYGTMIRGDKTNYFGLLAAPKRIHRRVLPVVRSVFQKK